MFFITAFIDPWLENNQRERCVLNFYSNNNRMNNNTTNTSVIYFLGTSQVKEGIDCYIIQDYFNNSTTPLECYNLAVNADSPLRRLTELDSIVRTTPDMVIIGVQISDIYKNSDIQDSRLMLLSNRVILDNVSAGLFSEKERGLLNMNPVSKAISERIYIVSYINYITINRYIPNSLADYEYRNNFKNPYKNVENFSIDEKIIRLNREPVNDSKFSEYYENSTNKIALKHIVEELRKNNITVIIISIPSDPLRSKFISNATRANYHEYLNSLHVTYYDFENRYPSSYFHDVSHMNEQGRASFSRDIAGILIRQVDI
jgi:hypothetical protein